MDKHPFWNWSQDQLFESLKSKAEGLSGADAAERLKTYGPNSLRPPQKGKGITLFLSQFKSPLILLLMGAAVLSYSLSSPTDGTIIFTIVFLSALLGFFQERGALTALEEVMQIVHMEAEVLRDGQKQTIPVEAIVPGDIVLLNTGDIVPADCIVLESNALFIDESTLSGESVPVEKTPEVVPADTPLAKRTNTLFLGTTIASGTGKVIVTTTGKNTEYSQIVEKIRFYPPETAFEIGVRKFSTLLLIWTIVLVVAIFGVNFYLQKPLFEVLLFSLAIGVGLVPQLLPAIITVNLSHGARRMAKKHVVVKRLASLEDFGQMNTLCCDKTGTLTIGKPHFEGASFFDGSGNDKGAWYAFLNAHFQTSYVNPLDQAILEVMKCDASQWSLSHEIPYDFHKKRLSIVCKNGEEEWIISKGAMPQIFEICTEAEYPDGRIVPFQEVREQAEKTFQTKSEEGFRTVAIAYGHGSDEANLTFLGFLHFMDPPKQDIAKTVEDLTKKGIKLIIITGDQAAVALHVTSMLGMNQTSCICGAELKDKDEGALAQIVGEKNVFAEIEPQQKEALITALQKAGKVVGYLGDGVNDVAALHKADVGIAVDTGAEAAKQAADIVLLKKELSVLVAGLEEGRRTFVNTMKYVYMATSANFGNMLSMAGASFFLSFLPLLPKQVLLTNFLSDLPEMSLAWDRVDSDAVHRPVKWDHKMIHRFMILFGLLSSIADCATFVVLFFWLKADPAHFRSAWFIESVLSATLVVLVIRTRHSIFRSKPASLLICAVVFVACATPLIAYTPLGPLFSLMPIPISYYGYLGAIIACYLVTVEIAKRLFIRHHKNY